jgi:hypothetical protein
MKNFIARLLSFLERNKNIIIITFELFWIIVFIMEKIGSDASEIPQFIYVNF